MMTMDACANFEEELTVDLPLDLVATRSIGLVDLPADFAKASSGEFASQGEDEEEATVVETCPEPVHFYPPHFEPPIGRALKQYYGECLKRARELREYNRIQYADTLYHRSRRLFLRVLAHMKANAKARPWEDYEKMREGQL